LSLRFGTAGIPLSTSRPGTVHGIRRVRELGLECLEMSWGNGVRMSGATADRIHEARLEDGLELAAHAPYYVNLCGAEDVVERSMARLIEAGVQGGRCGAASFCFHPGWYGGQTPSAARKRVAARLRQLTRALRDRGASLDARRHVPLLKSEFRWRDLLRALHEVHASGWVICETPAMEEDALRPQRFYRRIA
jgi:deoxyribonuclease-4